MGKSAKPPRRPDVQATLFKANSIPPGLDLRPMICTRGVFGASRFSMSLLHSRDKRLHQSRKVLMLPARDVSNGVKEEAKVYRAIYGVFVS